MKNTFLNAFLVATVIGSGFAGLPIALRAVAEGRRTIVIEAGSYPGRWLAGATAALAYSNSGMVD